MTNNFCAYPDDEYSQFSDEEYFPEDSVDPIDYPITLYKEEYPITPCDDDLAPKGIVKKTGKVPLPPGLSLSKSVFFKAPTNKAPVKGDISKENEPVKGDDSKGDVSKKESWYDSDDDPESDMPVGEITKLYNWNVPQVQSVEGTPEFPTLDKIVAPKPRREKIPAFSKRSFTRISTKEFLTPKTPDNTPMPSPAGELESEGGEKDEKEKPKKNKVCKNWEAGECKRPDCVFLHYYPPCFYADRCKNPHCKFVHSVKNVPEQKKFKTRICWHWEKHGVCKIDNCCFIHDLNDPAIKYCLFADNCENEQCRFFHVPKNMQVPVKTPLKTPVEIPVKTPIKTPEKTQVISKKPAREPKKENKKKPAPKKPGYDNMFSVLVETN
jgi:hypothetical protein